MIIVAIYKNYNTKIAVSLETKIVLKIVNILVNYNVTIIVIAKVSIFYLIFRSFFIFSLVKIVMER